MPNADELKAEGNAALKANDAAGAIAKYTEAIALEPSHLLYSNRSAAHAQRGDWEAALSDASDCVALDPNWPKGWCRKGAAHYALNDFGAAVAAYEAALKLTPTDSGIQAALADAQAAGERKKREALMMPAVMEFARRKQAGAAMLAEKRYADAAAEYRSALAAMEELAGQQGGGELSAPLQQMLTSVRRGMEEQLVEATRKEQERAAAES